MENTYSKIRPSQVTKTFGPGSIYDNQWDSMIIMGLDYWNPKKFTSIQDELLLQEVNRHGFDSVEKLISISSFVKHNDPGTIPVKSFPMWGFCPMCDKLVYGRNNRTRQGMRCDSEECHDKKRNRGAELPRTYPVRFVAACSNGHLDEFPWYEWVHRTKNERNQCGVNNSRLYLTDDSKSLSLESKTVRCRGSNCITQPQKMSAALSKNGLKFIGFRCTKKRFWLDRNSDKCEDMERNPVYMKGMFKGSTNMYFPIIRSAVTIPPFSDELSTGITNAGAEISRLKNDMDSENFKQYLVSKFQLKSKKYPDGRWTVERVLDMITRIEEFSKKNKNSNVYELEFNVLDSGDDFNDTEFVTENLKDISPVFRKYLSKVVLVRKARVVSAITGFTRIVPPDIGEKTRISGLSKTNPTWLPVMENRGEGIFFRFNNKSLNEWQNGNSVKKRFNEIITIPGRTKTKQDTYKHNSKYVFLHTFSHIIMRGLAKFAGYSTSSLTERIYCSDEMSGILIYTSSPSSDGALGGLVELGRKNENKLWTILENSITESTSCSYDPLCSIREPKKTRQFVGASCHACVLLPETCCENMNSLLDRDMIDHTIRDNMGFISL